MPKKIALILCLGCLVTGAGIQGQDLFEEAGHALGHSRWVVIRFLPAISIALEMDDVVLVKSIDHPAKGFAMKIDGKALAGDCAVTESKDTEYSTASSTDKKKSNWTTGTTTTSTTYWSRCEFDEGVAAMAQEASEIIVQVAMTNGNTKPHQLKTKELRKFQRLD